MWQLPLSEGWLAEISEWRARLARFPQASRGGLGPGGGQRGASAVLRSDIHVQGPPLLAQGIIDDAFSALNCAVVTHATGARNGRGKNVAGELVEFPSRFVSPFALSWDEQNDDGRPSARKKSSDGSLTVFVLILKRQD